MSLFEIPRAHPDLPGADDAAAMLRRQWGMARSVPPALHHARDRAGTWTVTAANVKTLRGYPTTR